jgi:RNA polymerase sigma-B factor
MERDPEALRERFRDCRSSGDPAIRDELVGEHIGLARHRARRFADRGEPLDDLDQVAFMGLVKAVDRFDPEVGTPFAGYAVPTMLGELRRHFRDATWAVHVSRRAKDLHVRLGPTTAMLEQQLGRSPTPAELAAELGTGVEEVLEAVEAGAAYRTHPIDRPPDHGGRAVADRLVSPRLDQEAVDAQLLVERLMADLPERERRIVELRFVDELSQSEIAARLGISQMHVSRLLRKVLAGMREELSAPDS